MLYSCTQMATVSVKGLNLCGVVRAVMTSRCIVPCVRYAVAEWYEAGLCDREVAGSTPARGVAAVYQRLLSVPSIRGRLMSSSLRATG